MKKHRIIPFIIIFLIAIAIFTFIGVGKLGNQKNSQSTNSSNTTASSGSAQSSFGYLYTNLELYSGDEGWIYIDKKSNSTNESYDCRKISQDINEIKYCQKVCLESKEMAPSCYFFLSSGHNKEKKNDGVGSIILQSEGSQSNEESDQGSSDNSESNEDGSSESDSENEINEGSNDNQDSSELPEDNGSVLPDDQTDDANDGNNQQVPEFSTAGLLIAVAGLSIIIIGKRK